MVLLVSSIYIVAILVIALAKVNCHRVKNIKLSHTFLVNVPKGQRHNYRSTGAHARGWGA